jgi:two-component system, sensor histidine kinase ChiS
MLSLLVAASCLGLAGCARTLPTPVARGGVLDLRGVDLAQVRDIQGPWEFHWRRLLGPGASREESDAFVGEGVWTGGSLGLADTGFATYRLRVQVDTSRVHQIAFSLKESGSAYALWVDGTRIISNGQVGTNRAEETPEYAFRTGVATVRGPEFEVLFQTSNFHANNGGIFFPIRIGTPEAIQAHLAFHVVLQTLVLGGLLLLALQYLVIWGAARGRRNERASLLFSLFCFAWSATILTESGELRLLSLAVQRVPFELLNRVDSLALLAASSLGALFIGELFPFRHLRVTNALLLPCAVAVGGAVCFLPLSGYQDFFEMFLWIGCAAGVSIAAACALAVRSRMPNARLFAVGTLLFALATINDMLRFAGMTRCPYMMTYGVAALAACMALILSRRTHETGRQNEALLREVRDQNRELERLARVKDNFLANTSHELRTPLHAIQGLTQAVLADARSSLDERARRSLDLVRGNARRLAVLVDDLLDTARLHHHEVVLRRSKVDMVRLAREILDGFRLQAAGKSVALRLDAPQTLPAVDADPDRIVQVLVNLVSNALRFTDSGSVGIRLIPSARRVLVEVDDTGPGIAPTDRDRIFERFEQGEVRRGGTGLGLSISRDLVRLHGGELSLESVVGKGSAFRFDLPVATEIDVDSPKDAPSDLEGLVPTPGTSGIKVLAVDDEPTNLRIVQAFLEPSGIGVVPLLDGAGLEDRIEEHSPDLVLLDVMLPGEDGFALCRRIRLRWAADELPVLFLSARTAPEDVEQGFAAGGNDYVPKPFLREELLARVGALLMQRQATRQLDDEDLRARMCRLLERALEVWSDATGQGKADLAKASGLWKVQMDRNGWRRTATLDRYLELAKLPKIPKWRPVLRTVRFVAARAEVGEAGAALMAEADLLETMLGRGGD